MCYNIAGVVQLEERQICNLKVCEFESHHRLFLFLEYTMRFRREFKQGFIVTPDSHIEAVFLKVYKEYLVAVNEEFPAPSLDKVKSDLLQEYKEWCIDSRPKERLEGLFMEDEIQRMKEDQGLICEAAELLAS